MKQFIFLTIIPLICFRTNSKNLLDDMIDMMEKYAHDLEVALNERTGQLTVEKEKSEKANYLSLPE